MVTTTADGIVGDGECALREAVRAANLNLAVDTCPAGEPAPVVDVIVLGEADAPYRLTVAGPDDSSGDLDIFSALDIVGAPSTIDASGLGDRVLELRTGAVTSLIMVSFRGGDAGSHHGGGILAGGGAKVSLFRGSVRGNRAGFGAGLAVMSGAEVTLHDSDVSSNLAAHGVYVSSATLGLHDSTVADNEGAGVLARDAVVTVASSTVSGNRHHGLRAAGTSTVTIASSTVSGNGRLDLSYGGGLMIEAPAAATLYYSTVTGNEALVGGGVDVTGSLTLKGTILGANHASFFNPDCYSEGATITSQGHNLIQIEDCELVPLATDRIGLPPQLDALADWGGPTRTHRLLPGSPALDGGDPADFPASDQRREGRPRHGDADTVSLPDIGAHENGNTLIVTSGADPGSSSSACTLRAAIRAANTDTEVDGCRAGFERDLIWIDPAVTGAVSLALAGSDDQAAVGDLDVRGDVDLAGLPFRRAAVDGGGVDRVFEVHAPARLELSHLDVTGGSGFLIAGGGLRVGSGSFAALYDVGVHGNLAVSQPGGGAMVAGELRGEDVWFHDNTTDDVGGGIALSGSDARLELRRARVSSNHSTQSSGGGLAVVSGRARLQDVTVADNEAAADGGGIHTTGTVILRSATVVGNRADADGILGGSGGGIRVGSGSTFLVNTLLADNLGAFAPDCDGTLSSGGYNLVRAATCGFAATTGDLTGVDPRLAPPSLGVYSTLDGSPARDAGSPEPVGSLGTSCARRDGVGVLRPIDGDMVGGARCDIGAVEGVGSAMLDVDGNGEVTSLTDGLLVIRYLFGFSGDSLISGAVAPGAPRSSSATITLYLDSITSQLDADGNGTADALTDGILILRYLFGMTGSGLIQGAIGPGATRTTDGEIAAYLAPLAGLAS